MARRKTNEEIIAEFRAVHGDKYGYEHVEYVKAHTPVRIVCSEHGEFMQSPHHHRRGRGCPKCGAEATAASVRGTKRPGMTTDEFVSRAREVHGDKYDYSLTRYERSDHKVRIICPRHGEFLQEARAHLKGRGCSRCAKRGQPPGLGHARTIQLDEFLRRVEKAHGRRYLIDTSSYSGINAKVRVKCRQHGWFEIQGRVFAQGQGCRKCAEIGKTRRYRRSYTKTTEQFVAEAKAVHGDRYRYHKARYRGAGLPVTIVCPKHGPFAQLPSNHVHGQGCPACARSESTTEREIREKFAWLGAVKGTRVLGRYDIDIWLPRYNVGLEYHGAIWHSTKFRKDKYLHRNKADAADQMGIRLLQVFDFEWADLRRRRIIEGILMRACGRVDHTIGARECELHTGVDASAFFDQNHLSGSIIGRSIVLVHNDEILAAMLIRQRLGRMEVLRYAEKVGVRVIGGLERLFANYVRSRQEVNEVWTYVDRRFFTGTAFSRAGFIVGGKTIPNYVYVNSNGLVKGTRMSFTRSRLQKMLGERFRADLTEEENARRAGMYRLYDAGNLRMVWRRSS